MSGIVGIARSAWGVECVRIRRRQWQAVSEPVDEIRVGDKRCTERDGIGLASGESIVAAPLIVTAIFNEGPFIGVADAQGLLCLITTAPRLPSPPMPATRSPSEHRIS